METDFGISRFLTELAAWVVANTSVTIIVGLMVFLIALWILPMTKWGRTNPVGKCVGLSVFAHIFLLCYAYGTSIITEIPVDHPPAPVPIKVTAQAAELPSESDGSESSGRSKPFWNQVDHAAANQVAADAELTPTRQEVFQSLPEHSQKFVMDPKNSDAQSLRPNMKEALPQGTAAGDGLSPTKISQTELQQTTTASSGSQSISGKVAARYFQSSNEKFQVETEFQADKWLSNQLQTPGLNRQLATRQSENIDLIDPMKRSFLAQKSSSSWDIKGEREASDQIKANLNTSAQSQTFGGSKLSESISGQSVVGSNSNPVVKAKSRPSVYRRIVDGKIVPQRYHLRFHKDRQTIVQSGASQESERAVQKALAYLARTQKANGSFDPRQTEGGKEKNVYGHNRKGAGAQADTGITGLALLAWMANGNTHLEGPYKENVRLGINYLIQRQQKNGSLAGSAQFFAQMYCHSMALLAISEAYALTGDPELAKPLQLAVDYSRKAQNKTGGGWRYRPGENGDMSQFGWQVMALVSANLAGTPINQDTTFLMNQFLDRHSTGKHKGLSIYRTGEQPSSTMTAEALFCRFLLKRKVNRLQIEEACRKIVGYNETGQMNNLPTSSGNNLYFWYYGTLALHQATKEPAGAKSPLVKNAWKNWNQALQSKLTSTQQIGGQQDGSWDPDEFLWGCYGGRVYTTSMAVLNLQIYYRYDLKPNRQNGPIAGRVSDLDRK